MGIIDILVFLEPQTIRSFSLLLLLTIIILNCLILNRLLVTSLLLDRLLVRAK